MRIAIVTESFRPDVNGVAHSVLRVAEHLVRRGHRPLVIAPRPARGVPDDEGAPGYPVVRVPSLPMPGYGRFRLGLPSRAIRSALTGHRSEIVHLASPFCLGARGSAVAQHLGLPAIAVYQTDVPGYARAYHTGRLGEAAAWRWLRGIHDAADRTLAPSTASAACLHSQGIQRVWLWGRGVGGNWVRAEECTDQAHGTDGGACNSPLTHLSSKGNWLFAHSGAGNRGSAD